MHIYFTLYSLFAETLQGSKEYFPAAQGAEFQDSAQGYAGHTMGGPEVYQTESSGTKRPREEFAMMASCGPSEFPTEGSQEFQDPSRRVRYRPEPTRMERLESSPILYVQEFIRQAAPELKADLVLRSLVALLRDTDGQTLDRLLASEGPAHVVAGRGGKKLVFEGSAQDSAP